MFSVVLGLSLRCLFQNEELRTPKSQRRQVSCATLELQDLNGSNNSAEVVYGLDVNSRLQGWNISKANAGLPSSKAVLWMWVTENAFPR